MRDRAQDAALEANRDHGAQRMALFDLRAALSDARGQVQAEEGE